MDTGLSGKILAIFLYLKFSVNVNTYNCDTFPLNFTVNCWNVSKKRRNIDKLSSEGIYALLDQSNSDIEVFSDEENEEVTDPTLIENGNL